jgi:hypothetical protein
LGASGSVAEENEAKIASSLAVLYRAAETKNVSPRGSRIFASLHVYQPGTNLQCLRQIVTDACAARRTQRRFVTP